MKLQILGLMPVKGYDFVISKPENFEKALDLYEKLKPSIEQGPRAYLAKHLEREMESRLAGYIRNLAHTKGWNEAVEFYRRVPDSLLPFDVAHKCAAMIYDNARKKINETVQTNAESNEVLKQKFANDLDILAMGASWNTKHDHDFSGADKVEFVEFMNRTGRFPEMISTYTNHDFLEEQRIKIAPILFQNYLKYNPRQIISEIHYYKDEYRELPLKQKQGIVNEMFEQNLGHLLISGSLNDLSEVPLTSEQKEKLKDMPADLWVNNVLSSQANMDKLELTQTQLIDIVVNKTNGPEKLVSALPGLNLSEERARYAVQALYKSNSSYVVWLNYPETSKYLEKDQIENLIERSIDSPNGYWGSHLIAVADQVEMTPLQRKKLVNNLLEAKRTDAILKNFYGLGLSGPENEQLILEVAAVSPEKVIDNYGYGQFKEFSSEGSRKIKTVLARSKPAEFLFQFNGIIAKEEREDFAQLMYLEHLRAGKSQFLVIKNTTGIDFKYTGEAKKVTKKFLTNLKPSQYHDTLESLQTVIPEQDLPKIPWASTYDGLLKLQSHSENEAYDPWKTDLDPLIEYAKKNNILDPEQEKDGKALYEFVHTYGMYNLPTILRWHKAVSQAKEISDIPDEVRAELESCLDINLNKLPNKGFVTQRVKEFRQKLQTDLLTDKLPEKVYSTEAGLELFMSLKGSTKWERTDDDPREIIKQWQDTAKEKPKLAEVPKGYNEVTIEVPMAVRKSQDASEVEQRLLKEKRLLENKELITTLNRFQGAYEQAFGIVSLEGWWDQQKSSIIQSLSEERQMIEKRIADAPNEKAASSMSKQLASLVDSIKMMEQLHAPQDNSSEVSFVDNLVKSLPKKLKQRDDILRTVTAHHTIKVMSEAQRNALQNTVSNHYENFNTSELTQWRNHLIDYLNEHYLHPDQKEHQTGHEGFTTAALKELQFVWGTKDAASGIISQSEQKLQNLNNADYQIGQKKVGITLIPVKGLLRVYSGDLGDACYTSKHSELAKGEFPGITGYVFVVGRGTNDERLKGSVLAIETKTPKGEKVLVVRANNPQENLLNQVDSDTLVQLTLDEMKKVAARRGIKKVGIPLDNASASCSNRSKVANYYHKQYKEAEKIALVNEAETNFNGYRIWDQNDTHPVVDITSR